MPYLCSLQQQLWLLQRRGSITCQCWQLGNISSFFANGRLSFRTYHSIQDGYRGLLLIKKKHSKFTYYLFIMILSWCIPPARPLPLGCFLCFPILPWPMETFPLMCLVFFNLATYKWILKLECCKEGQFVIDLPFLLR